MAREFGSISVDSNNKDGTEALSQETLLVVMKVVDLVAELVDCYC
jgi:hypothetical protein